MSDPTLEYIDGNVHYKLWNCPKKFIPQNIYKFLELYDYVKQFKISMPKFENLSPRFWKSVCFYEYIYNEALIDSQKVK